MKKNYLQILLSFVLTMLIITGCSGGSGGSGGFNPPQWIQGVWGIQGVEEVVAVYEFTKDDFIVCSGPTPISYKAIYKDVTEKKSDTFYEFTINYGSITFHFDKISDTELTYLVHSDDQIDDNPKPLTKKLK